ITTKKKKKKKSVSREILSWVMTFAIAIVLAFLINLFLIRPSEVSGRSMLPNFHQNQMVFISKMPYIFGSIHRFDVVVIDSEVNVKRTLLTDIKDSLHYNVITSTFFKEKSDKFWIKRVIGLPGDVIDFKDNKVYINGEPLTEDYVNSEEPINYQKEENLPIYPMTIDDDKVFVMGDNRMNSTDSRVIGQVPISNIIGKVINH
ncbi:MAG: signal peptidase I, partial [Clostridiales bacterium]|nr:signal peptidase I [Clostridiales bacterium]